MSRGVELLASLPSSVGPDAWTFCSPACLAAWVADPQARAPAAAFAAEPAGLYLG